MGIASYFFTSESVTEGHPDKIADQISDAILDAVIAEDPDGRVACETMVTTGLAFIAGEITTDVYVEFPTLVRETIREIGYTRAKFGFDSETCAVISSIDPQSPDIAQGVDSDESTGKDVGAGDWSWVCLASLPAGLRLVRRFRNAGAGPEYNELLAATARFGLL